MKLSKKDIKKKIVTPTNFRDNLFKILDEIVHSKEPKIIKSRDYEFEISIKKLRQKKQGFFDKLKPREGIICCSEEELIYHNLGKWDESKFDDRL